MEKKIKIIDLLNKIANGEEVPKRIKKHWEYEYKYDELRDSYHYIDHENKRFDEEWLIFSMLNDEVKILDEEDKFEDITSWGKPALEELKTKDIKLRDLQSYIYLVALSQNELIKNQKKIISRLKDE